jgi:exodeoxyribonuclease V alpha subunit
MIRYFLAQGMDLLLAAPTGRAAKRMTEATGYEARTIHRLLEVGGAPGEGGGRAVFQKNEDNPLEADVVIIDETSMVDILLFHALLKAILPGTHLILVGDMDQLPSVVLKEIFRQAAGSDIIVNAHKINRGEDIRLDTNSKDFLFLERNDSAVIKQIAVWMLRDKLPDYCKTVQSEIQVLTPMRKGELGCLEMNRYMQSVLNPESPDKAECLSGENRFREGDKVMQTKNDYHLEWEILGKYGDVIDKGEGVFNGDIGVIKQINESGNFMKVEFDDRRLVTYPLGALEDLELAYAITIHKAQGSEYPAVILPLLDPPRMLRYRNLLYTGITRAKSCVVILGSSDTVRGMISEQGERRRYSSLKERILELEASRG